MAIFAPKPSKKNSFLIPSDSYTARCISIIDLGTQSIEWEKEIKLQRKIRFTFEIPDVMHVFNEEAGEQPAVVSKEFTLSMHEKGNLRPFINSWLGKQMSDAEAITFDIASLLGKDCFISIIHTEKDGNTYANIGSISKTPSKMVCDPPINELVEFSIEEINTPKFEKLHAFIQDKIKNSEEYKKSLKSYNDDIIDITDLPF